MNLPSRRWSGCRTWAMTTFQVASGLWPAHRCVSRIDRMPGNDAHAFVNGRWDSQTTRATGVATVILEGDRPAVRAQALRGRV